MPLTIRKGHASKTAGVMLRVSLVTDYGVTSSACWGSTYLAQRYDCTPRNRIKQHTTMQLHTCATCSSASQRHTHAVVHSCIDKACWPCNLPLFAGTDSITPTLAHGHACHTAQCCHSHMVVAVGWDKTANIQHHLYMYTAVGQIAIAIYRHLAMGLIWVVTPVRTNIVSYSLTGAVFASLLRRCHHQNSRCTRHS